MKFLTSLLLATTLTHAAETGWSFAEGKGTRDVLFNGKPVLRHMNEFDATRREETFKPFTHVFDFDGKAPITKGPGGQFTHHRGIFIGWNKTGFEGKNYDFWHCKNVIRKHVKYLPELEKADANSATIAALIEWPTPENKVVVRETQTITATKPAEGRLVLDVTFKLEAPNGPVKLDGDVQHAGVHFRATSGVEKTQKETVYTKPEGVKQAVAANGKPIGDCYEQCNWVVCQFTLEDKKYAVAHFNHPANPTPLQYSTRAYGRFGAFSKTEIAPDKPLTLRYRIIVTDLAKFPSAPAAEWQKQWDAFAKP